MNKLYKVFIPLLLIAATLSGCGPIGTKDASMSLIYGVAVLLSVILFISYCLLIPKKDLWMLLLFSSIIVVNIGYLTLAISSTLEEALLSNRISYLGSVFLPMSMLLIILNVIKAKYPKWFPSLLLLISIFVFLVAASPGYLDIYYKEVTLENINGVSVLNKVYGPWHNLYLFYLLSYFGTMIASIIYAKVKKKIESNTHSVILVFAVFVNICVWLLEQLVKIDFEFLSISYIISGSFLLGLHLIMLENEKLKSLVNNQSINNELSDADVAVSCAESDNKTKANECSHDHDSLQFEQYISGFDMLTQTERIIFKLYIAEKSTKEIMCELEIKENTLKFHNKNIYSKLGVSSRKQLLEVYRAITADEKNNEPMVKAMIEYAQSDH